MDDSDDAPHAPHAGCAGVELDVDAAAAAAAPFADGPPFFFPRLNTCGIWREIGLKRE